MLWAFLVSYERIAPFGHGYDGFHTPAIFEYDDLMPSLTKEEYLKCLKKVISKLAREGNVVMHGRGSHEFTPYDLPSHHVFVTASYGLRKQRVAAERGMSLEDAGMWLNRADKAMVSVFKHLLGTDLLDHAAYDLELDLDNMSYEKAARTIFKSIESASLNDQVAEFAFLAR